MLHLFDLQRLSVPDQFLAFAIAYLESARTLCARLCSDTAHANYADGAVVMSLTLHAQELFLKSAILQRAAEETFTGPNGHDVAHLERRYLELYPEDHYIVSVLFKREPPEIEGMDAQIAQELIAHARRIDKEVPEDQLHRYPTSRQGEPWAGLFAFEPHSFSRDIEKLRAEFTRLAALHRANKPVQPTRACGPRG